MGLLGHRTLASLSVQGQTPDTMFDVVAVAFVQMISHASGYVVSGRGHRPPVDKKFVGRSSGPSLRSSRTVLFGAVRMN